MARITFVVLVAAGDAWFDFACTSTSMLEQKVANNAASGQDGSWGANLLILSEDIETCHFFSESTKPRISTTAGIVVARGAAIPTRKPPILRLRWVGTSLIKDLVGEKFQPRFKWVKDGFFVNVPKWVQSA